MEWSLVGPLVTDTGPVADLVTMTRSGGEWRQGDRGERGRGLRGRGGHPRTGLELSARSEQASHVSMLI